MPTDRSDSEAGRRDTLFLEQAWNWAGRWPSEGAVRESALTELVELLSGVGMDAETLAASIAHHYLASGQVGLEEIGEALGEGVARLVDGVARMGSLALLQHQASDPDYVARTEGLRRLLLVMAEDVRVVLITLARQVIAMRGIKQLAPAERLRLAGESMDLYAPLANRLGIRQLKWELEDLAFRTLEPETYHEIAAHLDERRTDREGYIEMMVNRLTETMRGAEIRASIKGRPKHIYSIWRKMQAKDLDFKELFDVRAVRVLVDSIRDCYGALGVVHSLWPHVASEFDDYIAKPKGNMYQSLHTAVMGPGGKIVEIQIRTHDMDHHAELGVAAHWRYKEGGRHDAGMDTKIQWLRQLIDAGEEDGGGEDILERFRTEVLHDRVYVLSPQGRVVDLPVGATALDFAYAIHTGLGHRCRGAKVDGQIVPLAQALENGVQVEVLTTRLPGPSRDWLNPNLGYLTTAKARSAVRRWFRQQDHERNMLDGRDILDRTRKRLGLRQLDLEPLVERFKLADLDELHAALGRGDVSAAQIINAMRHKLLPAEEEVERPARRPPSDDGHGTGAVMVEGIGNLMTQMGRCCKPAPPDPIIGYITVGHGVTIHRQDCANVLRLDDAGHARLIEVSWGQDSASAYPVDIDLEAYDRQGLLRDISQVFSNERVNMLGANTHTERNTHVAHMHITVEVGDIATLGRLLDKLAQVKNVIDVRRKT